VPVAPVPKTQVTACLKVDVAKDSSEWQRVAALFHESLPTSSHEIVAVERVQVRGRGVRWPAIILHSPCTHAHVVHSCFFGGGCALYPGAEQDAVGPVRLGEGPVYKEAGGFWDQRARVSYSWQPRWRAYTACACACCGTAEQETSIRCLAWPCCLVSGRLFHGTGKAPPSVIWSGTVGLDPRCSGDKCLYGYGVYVLARMCLVAPRGPWSMALTFAFVLTWACSLYPPPPHTHTRGVQVLCPACRLRRQAWIHPQDPWHEAPPNVSCSCPVRRRVRLRHAQGQAVASDAQASPAATGLH
jgi:hypothetical protein